MKKRIFLALIILIVFSSISFISASEISVNDNYTSQDSSMELLAVNNNGVESDSSNILSIENVDTNLDENTIGASNDTTKKAVKIDAPDLELYYKNGTTFKATLSDIDGNKLANYSLIFTISGVNYTRTTDNNGQASIAINLNPGSYDINVLFDGSENYLDSQTVATCTVYPTIMAEDFKKYCRNDTQFYATFLNGDGSPLVDAAVTYNIHGVFYTRVTDDKGNAQLNINLDPGEYIITAIHPLDGYSYGVLVTVLPTIYSSNLTKVYRDNHQYNTLFVDGQGNPLKNVNAQYNIHGVFYTRTTNDEGIAQLNINIEPGEYIITAYHPIDKSTTANLITVIGSSSTYMITSNYTYNKEDVQRIDVKLMNSLDYEIPNQNITITVGGYSYNTITNDDGIATFIANLPAGHYDVDYTYNGVGPYTSSQKTDTITILDGKPVYFDVDYTVIYYNNSESFDVTVYTDNEVPITNEPVYFTINGATYTRTTDKDGIAKLNINLNPGIYDIMYEFNSTSYQRASDLLQIAVIDGNTSILSGTNITVGQGAGEKFPVKLTVGDVALPERNIIFDINGINYTRITNDNGVAEITINLGVGQYPIKYYYLGEDKIEASRGEAVVTVKERIATSLTWKSGTSFISDNEVILKVLLSDKDNKPLANKNVVYTIDSDSYQASTDSEGIATIKLHLGTGTYQISYKYEGDDEYLSSEGSTQITVSKSGAFSGFGYWSFGGDMYNIDLAQLSSLGTTEIFLNFYALTQHGESNVLSWIEKANSYGINVHIWMQVFYTGGNWVNPVINGANNQQFFNEIINEAKYYAGLPGVTGVHFDYLRYPGTAYQTSGGTAAITEFVKQVTTACRQVNPDIFLSASVMPETSQNAYYYGQDIPTIGQYLDAIVPMQYKGNYNTGSSWLASTTRWFVQNSGGAQVWSGLQGYISDNNPTKLSYNELFNDAQNVLDNGANGVIIFRFGLSMFLSFNDLVGPSYGQEIKISDIASAANYLKEYIETNLTLPNNIVIGNSQEGYTKYTIPQMLYLMSTAVERLNNGNHDDISSIIVDAPDNPTGNLNYSALSTRDYVYVANLTEESCYSNNKAPNYIYAQNGDIKYETLIYMFSRVLAYYHNNGDLPAMVVLTNFLDRPTLTVNMLPSYSTQDYQYINYTTTWLNYCPCCDYYGTLLINPKGTYEGEFTCAHCDADFCGVTGHEKIVGSDKVLTRLSESIPTDPGEGGDVVSIDSIIKGASYFIDYYAENDEYPDYIVVSEGKYSIEQFFYLMSKAIGQIDASNFNPVTLIDFGGPSSTIGDAVNGDLSKTQYLDVARRVANYIDSNAWIPNYASSDLGRIGYYDLVGAFASILDDYADDGALPSSVHIEHKSPSTKSIADLSKDLIKGLTTARAQATALYNYVRDYIDYEFYYDTQKGAEGTLIAGSGNCCDQAQLLVAMGRSVGLTVRFATGYCTFSSGSTYGHVWAQFLIDGTWINADPTSTRNSFGVINNWDTSSYTDRGVFDVLPY